MKHKKLGGMLCIGVVFLICLTHGAWAQKENNAGLRSLSDQLSGNRTSWIYKACVEDIKLSNNDDDKFIHTKCGFYIQGFFDGGIAMEYFLGDQFGKYIKREDKKLIKSYPYCFNKDISSLDVAKALIAYVDENPPKEMGSFMLTVALKEKYSCK